MDSKQAIEAVGTIDGAISKLSLDYSTIDDEWIARNRDTLDDLKSFYEDKGGIHVIDVDGMSCICRVPAREIMTRIAKKAAAGKNSDPLGSDAELFRLCLLYPKFDSDRVQDWLRSAPGYPTAVSTKLMELAKITVEATSKKL